MPVAVVQYRDRAEAGKILAEALESYAGRQDLLVLALPRGGLPVAQEVAQALPAPLDLMLVRKLGFPGREELAMGAVASGGVRVLNPEVAELVAPETIAYVEARERAELSRRERAYRGDRPYPELTGRVVFLVDDGLATGATMRAAIAAVRQRQPKQIVVAVPVAPREAVARLEQEADLVVCPLRPSAFISISMWYEDFTQVTDDEVEKRLADAWANADRANLRAEPQPDDRPA